MLSGQRTFHGDTAMDTMTAILKEDPPTLRIERHVPPGIERIVGRCLEKAPAARFKSADDLAFALGGLSGHSEATSAVAGRVVPARREQLAWAAAIVLLITTVALGARAYLARAFSRRAAPEMRLQIVTPPAPGISAAAFAVSPDGSQLAFIAGGQVWLRPLGSETAQPMEGSEGVAGNYPFWSPDSRSMGFSHAIS